MKGIKLKKLCEELELEIVMESSDFDTITITNSQVNRPGIQLSGFLEHFPNKRLQIIGKTEMRFLNSMTPDVRKERMEGMMTCGIPCIIFTQGQEVEDYIVELAKKHDKTIIRSTRPTTRLISRIDDKLAYFLSEQTNMHAGLMEVFGIGVLITGKSSVGKSETALDLIIRGHRLVADDVVEVRRMDKVLIGQAPKNIRHFLEIRGIGILDIQRLYGIGSVKPDVEIELVVCLEPWDDDKEYDRLGLDIEYMEILGVKVQKVIVPVKPGRDIAMIVEVAVRNYRQRNYGYNAAIELSKRLFANNDEE
ncbi:MAG: HPr(Ser) kinase/phosphatase [Lagierella massiliensis]|nr:HPr(Ser) kinase/phosphatase [Lagierella massiliensis]